MIIVYFMANQLNKVSEAYKNNSAFNGFTIHHYGSWIKIKE
jgi:hypothetical protein